MPEPFPAAEKAVCGDTPDDGNATDVIFPYEYKEPWIGPDAGGGWNGGQWIIPEVQNDTTGPPAPLWLHRPALPTSPSDEVRARARAHTGLTCLYDINPDLAYLKAAVEQMGALTLASGGAAVDTSRLFFTGCSMGSALTVWAAQCFHKLTPAHVTAFASQSTGLKIKGDGLTFPPDNYRPRYPWGECPTCKYFPAPVVKTSGLKACVTDQTSDPNFYGSSVALDKAWRQAGMRSNATFYGGGRG